MKTKAFLCAIVMSFALAGCSTLGGMKNASACPDPVCRVGIYVHADGTIYTKPDEPYIPVRTGPRQILWEVKEPGYSFVKDGIQFDGQGNGQYSDPNIRDGDTQATSENANTVSGRYKYTVRLKKGSQRFEKDPFIVNG